MLLGVLVGLTSGEPQDAFRVYDTTYLLYTDGWPDIDRVSAYLVNGQMREMWRSEESTSLIFDAVSEDLVDRFNEIVFVVGMTHVHTKEAVATDTSGHHATNTDGSDANYTHHR